MAQHFLLTAARLPRLGWRAEPEAGAMSVHGLHPAISEACTASILGHASMLEPDIAEAMETRRIEAGRTPARPAKAYPRDSPEHRHRRDSDRKPRLVALESVDHLERPHAALHTPPD